MTRQRRDSVTVREAIARKIDTQKNKAGIGNFQDRGERATTVMTASRTRTGHQKDKENRATTETTARNRSTC